MENEFQDLAWAKHKIEKIFETNRRKGFDKPSLSRNFKDLRKHPRFSLFGDAPLISQAIQTMVKLGATINRTQVLHALKFGQDFQGLENKRLKREFVGALYRSEVMK